MRIYNSTKGAISIFLAIVLMSMIILTGVIIDGSRARAASYEAKSALDLGLMSILSSYDNLLKEHYGLFAMSENNSDVSKELVTDLMNKTLMTELGIKIDPKDLKWYNTIMDFAFAKDPDKPSTNFFDYSVDEIDIKQMYNLSENKVLKNQILEHMKFRAPKVIGEEVLEKLGVFKNFSKQTKVLQDKTKVEEELKNVADEQVKLSDSIDKVNTIDLNGMDRSIEDIVNKFNDIIEKDKIIKIKEEEKKVQEEILKKKQEEITEYNKSRPPATIVIKDGDRAISYPNPDFAEWLKGSNKLSEERDAINKLINDINDIINTCKKIIEENKTSIQNNKTYSLEQINTCLKNIEDSLGNITNVQDKSKEANKMIGDLEKKVEDDKSEFGNNVKSDIDGKKVKINEEELNKRKDLLTKNKSALTNLKQYFSNIDPNSTYNIIKTDPRSQYDGLSVVKEKVSYDQIKAEIKNLGYIDYAVDKAPKKDESTPDPRDQATTLLNEFNKTEKESKAKPSEQPKNASTLWKSIPSNIDKTKYDTSIVFKDILKKDKDSIKVISDSSKATTKSFSVTENAETNEPEADFSESSSVNSMLGFVSNIGDKLGDLLTDMRDELYINEYVLGTFKNNLSEKRNEKYFDNSYKIVPKPSSDPNATAYQTRKTYFKNEVEYILSNKKTDNENLSSVKTKILLTRFGLNTLSIYTDAVKRQIALSIAMALVGWSGILVPIVHTLIMFAWSFAESILDLKLIMDGKEVPIFKTSATWVIGGAGAKDLAISMIEDGAKDISKEIANKTVDYTVEYSKENINKVLDASSKKIDDLVKQQTSIVVDNVFKSIENLAYEGTGNVSATLSSTTKNLSTQFEGGSSEFNGLIDKISEVTQSELQNVIGGSLGNGMVENSLNEYIINYKTRLNDINDKYRQKIISKLDMESQRQVVNKYIHDALSGYKDKLKKTVESNTIINDMKEKLKTTIDTKITDLGEKGKSKIGSTIDSIIGKSKSDVSNVNLKSSILSMGYDGYLRLFLLITGSEGKLTRIEDLIQLNVNTNSDKTNYMIYNSNTYLRAETKVSIKYLFMDLSNIYKIGKRNGRHTFESVLYKGY